MSITRRRLLTTALAALASLPFLGVERATEFCVGDSVQINFKLISDVFGVPSGVSWTGPGTQKQAELFFDSIVKPLAEHTILVRQKRKA
jgi:hypothetical protein